MSLSFTATLASRGFEVALEVQPGERVAVLGQNGSGKSTLLNLLAGTVRPDAGSATLDGRVLFDLGERAHTWVPPHRRGIALLAQDPLLFPHLSVIDNVAYAQRVSGAPKAGARGAAERWLDEVGAVEFAGRRPGELSGGQAQRVAIARALAAEPRLLLLDEPMAALDIAVAPLLRRVLRRVLSDRTTLLVTHDVLDALLLSDRLVVMEQGRIVESGPTEETLRHPRARFTARLAGLNLVRGTLDGSAVVAPDGFRLDGTRKGGEELADGGPAAAVFSPSDVAVYPVAPAGSPRNNLAVRIVELEPQGDLVRVRCDDHHGHVIAADVTPVSVAELDLYPGRDVVLSIKAASVTVYPA
ncbi:MAG: ABC transporter ATP-binding protein [Actinobacteria bacterium]|nr:ABC transporter ATP-binding protein [Actinomycetota bacterium]